LRRRRVPGPRRLLGGVELIALEHLGRYRRHPAPRLAGRNIRKHETMTALTKMDVNALRKADSLCVHLSKDYTAARAIKRNTPTEAEPFAHDLEHLIPCTIELGTGRGREELESGRAKCFAMLWLFPTQLHTAALVLRTLREGDEITFRFVADYHTNGYIAAAGLHADALCMDVRRQGKTIARWELETSTCPDNSSRMCKGIPDSDSYQSTADTARRVA
jgi:hypothetical protein